MRRFLFSSASLVVAVPALMLGPEFFVNQGVSEEAVASTMKMVAIVSVGALVLVAVCSLLCKLACCAPRH